MQSQEDIFATQSQTQNPKKTKVNYDYLVLCDLDDNVLHPFGLYPRGMFSIYEIQDKWLDSILDHSSRLKSLPPMEKLPDFLFSLFGKIEEGMYKCINIIKI